MTAIENLAELGKRLSASAELKEKTAAAEHKNPWFVPRFAAVAFDAVIQDLLDETKLNEWLKNYEVKPVNKTIGLIFAGNIPLVGLHDFLCCYVTGCRMQIKLSSKDDDLFLFLLKELTAIDPSLKDKVEIVETLKNYDAVIATGSNNTNRYFEYYFRNHPRILRSNRNSVAILTGDETESDLEHLAEDVFLYFGFGCRNVSKLYVPTGYDLTQLFPRFEKNYRWLHNHNKFMNNYDYNRTLLLLNKTPHLANDFFMLVENPSISSAIATLNYSYWHDERVMNSHLKQSAAKIQCVVSGRPEQWQASSSVAFGRAQHPGLADYADGADTLRFLISLS